MKSKSDDRLSREADIAAAVIVALELLSDESLMRIPALPKEPNANDIDNTLAGLALQLSHLVFEKEKAE